MQLSPISVELKWNIHQSISHPIQNIAKIIKKKICCAFKETLWQTWFITLIVDLSSLLSGRIYVLSKNYFDDNQWQCYGWHNLVMLVHWLNFTWWPYSYIGFRPLMLINLSFWYKVLLGCNSYGHSSYEKQ